MSGGATSGGGVMTAGGCVDHSSAAMPDIDAIRITSWAGMPTQS